MWQGSRETESGMPADLRSIRTAKARHRDPTGSMSTGTWMGASDNGAGADLVDD